MHFSTKSFSVSLLALAAFIISACKQEWQPQQKQAFLVQCRNNAAQTSIPNANIYCDCMLNGLIAKHPDPETIGALNTADLTDLGRDCMDSAGRNLVVWPVEAQNMFRNECLGYAEEQKIANKDGYCDCLLGRVMERYVTMEQVNTINADSMQALGAACKEEVK